MLGNVNLDHQETVPETPVKPVPVNVAENLYRVQLPNDTPGKPTGTYYALLKRGGKQFRRSLKTRDRKLAERRLADLRRQVENLVISSDSNLSFDQIADRWMAITSHTLKSRSKDRRLTSLKAVRPFFRGVSIRNISKTHSERWLTERGPRIAAQTFAHELSAMKRVFDYAVESGLILANPAAHIRRRRILQSKISVPSREQFHAIIAAARDVENKFGTQGKGKDGADLLELLAYSGCRLHEATELTWSHVDFDRGCFTVTGGEEGTKNQEPRTVPMTAALRDLLTRLSDERKPRRRGHKKSGAKDGSDDSGSS
jgi:integrase